MYKSNYDLSAENKEKVWLHKHRCTSTTKESEVKHEIADATVGGSNEHKGAVLRFLLQVLYCTCF